MKQKIANLIKASVAKGFGMEKSNEAALPEIEVEEPRVKSQGDFSTNISMIMASQKKMPPRKIAEKIIKNLDDYEGILDETEIAGPGFINFFIKPSAWHPFLKKVHDEDSEYGASGIGCGIKTQVEFVSANPTGPLHVGHGRGAVVGDSIANILSFCGYNVKKEYYINDSGRQIRTLGLSVYLRYKQLTDRDVNFPEDCYQGEYIKIFAEKIRDKHSESLTELNEDEAVLYCAKIAAENILKGIKDDLESFGVKFDNWFSEQKLYDAGKVDAAIQEFSQKGIIYKKDGALWFNTSDYGDEKDRVVVRQNGQTTYFASDIAYHQEKFERGFERIIDVWGADHHGYIPRVKASIEASGHKACNFNVVLVQLVNLLRNREPVAMSTRSGEFVTLKDVVDEVGADAARFIFLTRHYDSPLDFDLELAKKKTNENPVYYVQYVHARISSIIRKAKEKGINNIGVDDASASLLMEEEEIDLIKAMVRYPEVVESSARMLEPHRITFYLMNLAASFHSYYNKHRVLTDDDPVLTLARLYLIIGIKKVIKNGLCLLGVSAPEKM